MSVGLGPVSWPPGGLVPKSHQCCPGTNRFGHVYASEQHGLVQLFPNNSGVPVAQAPPAGHAAAVPKRLGKVFPWNACLQHEQDAVEGGLIADYELARTALGRRHEGRDEGL